MVEEDSKLEELKDFFHSELLPDSKVMVVLVRCWYGVGMVLLGVVVLVLVWCCWWWWVIVMWLLLLLHSRHNYEKSTTPHRCSCSWAGRRRLITCTPLCLSKATLWSSPSMEATNRPTENKSLADCFNIYFLNYLLKNKLKKMGHYLSHLFYLFIYSYTTTAGVERLENGCGADPACD